MPHIPIHLLNDRAEMGLEVKHFSEVKSTRSEIEGYSVHRDDHYVFLLIESGVGTMDVDFKQVVLVERDLYYIAPGQVHHNINAKQSTGWIILVAPSLIPNDYLEIFDNNLMQQKPCALTELQFSQCQDIVLLLYKQYKSDSDKVFYKQLTFALLDTFLCTAASVYLSIVTTSPTKNASRPVLITKEFRKLLMENVQSQKSPSYYASQLHISEVYLNEAVKKITGFTVTY